MSGQEVPWTPEQLARLLELPEPPVESPVGALDLLGEAKRLEMEAVPAPKSPREAGLRTGEQVRATLALHKVLPELGRVNTDPQLNWSRARALLEGVRDELGKAYRLALAIYAVALAKRQDAEQHVTFVMTRWELGAIIGVSDDYAGELLSESKVLRAMMFWGVSVEKAPFQKWARKQLAQRGAPVDEAKAVHHKAGLLFHVKMFDRPLTSNDLCGRVKGNEALFTRHKRNLAADVYRGHTKRALGEEGRLPRNARGTVRKRTLRDDPPQDGALDLLLYVTLRALGLLPYDALEDASQHVRDVNDLLLALRAPVTREREGRMRWVQICAAGFVRVLGCPRDVAYFLKLCWSAVGITGARFKDARDEEVNAIAMLYGAAFEVLVRSSDNPKLVSGQRRSKLMRYLLRREGFFEWRARYEVAKAA